MTNSLKTASNQRLSWVDYSKGIGIVLVVYGHVLRGLSEAGFIGKSYFYYSDNFVYSFHMPLFFILSGIFFFNSFKKNPSGFLLNKVKTLLYPFVIWSILQTLIEVGMNKFTNSKTPASELLTCLFIPRAQFWFLYALFFVGCINYLCFKINIKYGLAISFLIWVLYICFTPNTGPFDHTFQYLIFFDIGIAASMVFNRFAVVISEKKWMFLMIIVFAAAEYYLFYFGPKSVIDYSLPFVLAGVLGSAVIMQLSEKAVSKNIFMFFNYLGKESLPIYLVHIIVASGTRVILTKILKVHNPAINIIVAVVLGVIIPLWIYKFCSQRGYLAWLFKYPENNRRPKEEALPVG